MTEKASDYIDKGYIPHFRKTMLYDEEGKAFVEPPLIPEDQHLYYIVKDYSKMCRQVDRLEKKNLKLRETIRKVNAQQFAYSRLVYRRCNALDKMARIMKKNGLDVPSDIRILMEENKLLYRKSNKRHDGKRYKESADSPDE